MAALHEMRRSAVKNAPEPLSWPVRYLVTIEAVSGDRRTYEVLTWLDQHKALALAVQEDTRRYPEGPDSLFSVTVSEVGPAPKTDRGTVDVGSDLLDRMEF